MAVWGPWNRGPKFQMELATLANMASKLDLLAASALLIGTRVEAGLAANIGRNVLVLGFWPHVWLASDFPFLHGFLGHWLARRVHHLGSVTNGLEQVVDGRERIEQFRWDAMADELPLDAWLVDGRVACPPKLLARQLGLDMVLHDGVFGTAAVREVDQIAIAADALEEALVDPLGVRLGERPQVATGVHICGSHAILWRSGMGLLAPFNAPNLLQHLVKHVFNGLNVRNGRLRGLLRGLNGLRNGLNGRLRGLNGGRSPDVELGEGLEITVGHFLALLHLGHLLGESGRLVVHRNHRLGQLAHHQGGLGVHDCWHTGRG